MKIKCEIVKHTSEREECSVDKFCCKKMKQVLERKKSYCEIFSLDKCGIQVATNTSDYDHPTDYVYISYCPFCGEEIEL